MSEPYVPPPPPAGQQSQNRGLMIALSYLGILCLIPLLVEKDDKEVQWHAKHGLVLMIAEFIGIVGLGIVSFVLAAITHGVSGCVTVFLWPVICLGLLILHIMCIVKGINGERLIIPGISQYADRF